MVRTLLIATLLFGLAACSQPVYRQSQSALPVSRIDADRYLGLWHEAARLPNSFEQNCTDVTAEYGRRDDGLISVKNTCHDNGRVRVANGRAKPAGDPGEGKLKVSFFGPFWADYWVVERADDYSWSIVSEPGGRYLWVLTRARHIDATQRAFFETRIRALGYDPGDMIWG